LYPRVADRPAAGSWRVAYTSLNLSGIQAAVSVGLGVSFLPDLAVLDDHRVLRRKDGLPPITHTQLALLVAPDATSAARRLADLLAKFCGASATRNRSIQSSSRTS
jgi:DNA-binding transcriptional LysR family regulator